MISIGKLIHYVLVNTSNLVGSKVFPVIAPEDVQLPFIMYERNSINPIYTKDGLTGNETEVTIYILSDNYANAIDLAEKVRTAFERKNISYSGINVKGCDLVSATEEYNEYSFIQKLTFQFKTN